MKKEQTLKTFKVELPFRTKTGILRTKDYYEPKGGLQVSKAISDFFSGVDRALVGKGMIFDSFEMTKEDFKQNIYINSYQKSVSKDEQYLVPLDAKGKPIENLEAWGYECTVNAYRDLIKLKGSKMLEQINVDFFKDVKKEEEIEISTKEKLALKEAQVKRTERFAHLKKDTKEHDEKVELIKFLARREMKRIAVDPNYWPGIMHQELMLKAEQKENQAPFEWLKRQQIVKIDKNGNKIIDWDIVSLRMLRMVLSDEQWLVLMNVFGGTVRTITFPKQEEVDKVMKIKRTMKLNELFKWRRRINKEKDMIRGGIPFRNEDIAREVEMSSSWVTQTIRNEKVREERIKEEKAKDSDLIYLNKKSRELLRIATAHLSKQVNLILGKWFPYTWKSTTEFITLQKQAEKSQEKRMREMKEKGLGFQNLKIKKKK